jgi:hypothetical protein
MKVASLFAALLATTVVFAAGSAGAAEKLTDNAPFVCVPTTVWECTSNGDCQRGTAQTENLPKYFSIDIAQKTIRAGEKGRRSTIERVIHNKNNTVLYGMDEPRSWIVVINPETGDLSASVVGDGESFVLYGVCLAK